VPPTDEWAAPVPRHPDRWRALAPAAVLLVIALVGVRNHVMRDQSSWQGASFGMFATFENDISRSVAVTVDDGEGPRRVRLPEHLEDDVRRLEVVPTDEGAAELAEEVAELLEPGSVVHVEVRRIDLTRGDPMELSLQVLASGTAKA